MSETNNTCELCTTAGGEPVWQGSLCRVVLIEEADYPGYCRVVLNRHEREMSDLPGEEQQEMMRVVFTVEAVLRRLIDPDKINLASLGNITPHVHWHVIPRWTKDRCFPNPIWGLAQRSDTSIAAMIDVQKLKQALAEQLGEPNVTSDRSIP